LKEIEKQVKVQVGNLNLSMKQFMDQYKDGKIDEAQKSINQALTCQGEINILFDEMERVIKFIERLSKKEYKAMRKEVKRAV